VNIDTVMSRDIAVVRDLKLLVCMENWGKNESVNQNNRELNKV
jgi:hypothetical protein